jgi:UDP-3-O-[3-hydroxymyristoyl] glucosamine N-acyltransferase
MRPAPAALLLTALALPAAALDEGAGKDPHCTIEAGPGDLVAQDRNLTVPAGASAREVVVLRGNVVLERGAAVEKVVVAAGSVTLRPGAVVRGDAVVVGGDLALEGDARVEGNAVALGGQVRVGAGSAVKGDVTSVAFRLGEADLRRAFTEAVGKMERCDVVEKAAR